MYGNIGNSCGGGSSGAGAPAPGRQGALGGERRRSACPLCATLGIWPMVPGYDWPERGRGGGGGSSSSSSSGRGGEILLCFMECGSLYACVGEEKLRDSSGH